MPRARPTLPSIGQAHRSRQPPDHQQVTKHCVPGTPHRKTQHAIIQQLSKYACIPGAAGISYN